MEKILDLFKTFGAWFTVLIVGVAFVIVSILGEIPRVYVLTDTFPRIGIGILGFAIMSVAGVALWRQTFDTRWGKKNAYGIRFHSPVPSSKQPNGFYAAGEYRKKPKPSAVVYIVEFNPNNQLYWPKNPLNFDPETKRWSSEVKIGTQQESFRTILIAEISPAGLALIDYYREVSTPGSHKGIRNFDRCFVELDRVTFIQIP
jgi:hypothetical protein